MSIPLKHILDALPPKRRTKLDRRFKKLMNELESTKELPRNDFHAARVEDKRN